MWQWIKTKYAGYRTIVVGALVSFAGVALLVLDALAAVDIAALLPPDRSAAIIAALGVVKILLRLITTGPVRRP